MTTQFIVRLVDTTGHTPVPGHVRDERGRRASRGRSPTCGSTRPTRRSSTRRRPPGHRGQQAIGGGERLLRRLHRQSRADRALGDHHRRRTSRPTPASTRPGLDNPPTSYVGVATRPEQVRSHAHVRRRDATADPGDERGRGRVRGRPLVRLLGRHDDSSGDVYPNITTLAVRRRRPTARCGARTCRPSVPPRRQLGPAAHPLGARAPRHARGAARPHRHRRRAEPRGSATDFMYRYCVNSPPSCATNDGTLRWARARTVTAEVSLPNQSQDFF